MTIYLPKPRPGLLLPARDRPRPRPDTISSLHRFILFLDFNSTIWCRKSETHSGVVSFAIKVPVHFFYPGLHFSGNSTSPHHLTAFHPATLWLASWCLVSYSDLSSGMCDNSPVTGRTKSRASQICVPALASSLKLLTPVPPASCG